MSFRLYWAWNDGIAGHVWLGEGDMRSLREEMALQGMADGIPLHKLETPEHWRITPQEIEEALAVASDEPLAADTALWRDWLAFLGEARHKGGVTVR